MKTRFSAIIGVDEVGRGALAGPLVVCACAVGLHETIPHGVTDSKKLTPHMRTYYAQHLGVLNHAFSHVTPRVIDERGITYACNVAVKRVLKKLNLEPCATLVLLDGRLGAPPLWRHAYTITHGDARHRIIGAASILAKVRRDTYMIRKATELPHYGFDRHKGYGTAHHRAMITAHGPSHMHRTTWLS